ncbi:MAG TPA: polysaccharide biosynthesis/export family protein [Terriglobales bacterium]|nr:polysaccharide biosynthesis/export family protein [Terriglobales bacterium]
MKTNTILILLLCLGLQVSVASHAQTSQSVMTAGDAGHAVLTKSGGADGVVGSPALSGERHPLYRLRASDVIEISFTFAPEFNQTVTVQPDGFITLKGLEKQMYTQGMTLPELRDGIRTGYAGILHEPEIAINLKEFDRPYFIASGEVGKPGKYDLHGDTTVTEAVAIAGGFTGQAKHSQVVLFRHVSDETVEAKLLNIKSMLSNRDLREDVHLRPGDMLFVPQSMISKIRRYLPVSSLGMYTQKPI